MDIQWPLTLFSLLAGCGGGILCFLALGEFKKIGQNSRFKLAILALIIIIVGGCCSVLHLGKPSNIMAAAANVGSFSGISVELIFLGVSVIAAAVYAIGLKRGASEGALKGIAVVAGVLGFILAFVTGNGYVMESQVNWNTPLLPLCYLISGLTMGGAVYASVLAKDGESADSLASVFKIELVLAVVEIVLFLAYDAVCGMAGNAVAFWVCALVIGGIGTAACFYLANKKTTAIYAGAACAVIGVIGIRCTMWLLGTGFLSLFATIAGRGVLGL